MFQRKKTATIGVIGLGRFGMALAKRLCELGEEVLVIDASEAKVKEMRAYTEFAFVCDNLEKETLEEAGIADCEVVIVCIGEKIDVCILAALNVVSLGVPKVIAKAISDEQGYILEKIGVEVIFPERDMALRLAKKIVATNVVDYISLNSEVEILETKIASSYVGKKVMETNIRQKYGLNIIAIEHGGETITEIDPSYVFAADDLIVVIGKRERIEEFEMAERR